MLITGQLTGNAEEGFESIIVQCVITTPYRHSQSRTIEMGKDGSFRIAMDSPIPYQDIYLRVGDCYSTGLIVKDGMHLELNWEKLQASSVQLGVGDGVKYSGNDAAMNQFLCEYRVSSLEAMTKERDRVFEASRMQRLPADELLVVLNDVLEKGRERNKEYLANQPESVQGFAWMLEEESLNSYYGDVLIGFIGREIPDEVWQECISHQPVMLSASSVSYYHNFVLCLGQPMLAELHDYVVETLEGKIADEDREEFEAYVKCFVDARNGREYDKELFQRGGQKFMVSNTEAFQKARLACFAKRVQHVPK
ncbi:hypothetical protein OAG68_02655, partial [bacterium]|nr:hypothetical protein [bacterium]